MEKSNKRVKRPTDNKYKRGRGIHRGIIILVILSVVITSGYIIYNRYIKKEDKKDEKADNKDDTGKGTDEKIKSNDKPQKEEVTEQKSNSSKNKKSKKER